MSCVIVIIVIAAPGHAHRAGETCGTVPRNLGCSSYLRCLGGKWVQRPAPRSRFQRVSQRLPLRAQSPDDYTGFCDDVIVVERMDYRKKHADSRHINRTYFVMMV